MATLKSDGLPFSQLRDGKTSKAWSFSPLPQEGSPSGKQFFIPSKRFSPFALLSYICSHGRRDALASRMPSCALAPGQRCVNCVPCPHGLASCQGERWLTKVHLSGYSSVESSHVKSTFKDLKANRNHQILLQSYYTSIISICSFCRILQVSIVLCTAAADPKEPQCCGLKWGTSKPRIQRRFPANKTQLCQ